ncbi:MAG: S41 family peptidase [Lachnospiraceae bacterium]|nr:S41 family peptidase [Lachnospiraceae bacterium]
MEDQLDVQKNTRNHAGRKYFWGGMFSGLLLALFLMRVVYASMGLQKYLETRSADNQANAGKQDDSAGAPGQAASEELLQKMQLVEAIIDRYFYQEDTDKQAMIDGALKGMVNSLGDPYSEYYTAQELADVLDDIQGIYYGIGAYVQMDTDMGLGFISGVIEGAPASEVDIREGDYIYAVDGVEAYGKTLTEVVAMIKGPEGSKVTITFIRQGQYVDVEVERRQVESPTVNSEMYEGGMAYIQITEFDEATIDQFADAMAVARGSEMKGLILDLRSNPGGSLNAVVEIARQMLPEGMIVYTEDRAGNRREYKCDGDRKLEVPMVVLVNGNSASASEILAGAIKDYGIGRLLGTTTFGKGIVQQPISLGDGSAVKLTISSYFTPNGINIHGTGIEPDEVCEFDGERYYSDEKYDNQLERAKEVLAEMIKGQN